MSDRARSIRLVLRAQAGDRDAEGALLREMQERIFAYLLGLLGDRHLAEDVLQDVFVIVLRKLRWLREPEALRPWVHRIATREAFKALRRRKPTQPLDEVTVPESPPDPEPPDADLLLRLPELAQAASPASRAVLLLHYGEELSLEETARVLGLGIGTVKSRLAYGLAALRRRLGVSETEDGKERR